MLRRCGHGYTDGCDAPAQRGEERGPFAEKSAASSPAHTGAVQTKSIARSTLVCHSEENHSTKCAARKTPAIKIRSPSRQVTRRTNGSKTAATRTVRQKAIAMGETLGSDRTSTADALTASTAVATAVAAAFAVWLLAVPSPELAPDVATTGTVETLVEWETAALSEPAEFVDADAEELSESAVLPAEYAAIELLLESGL